MKLRLQYEERNITSKCHKVKKVESSKVIIIKVKQAWPQMGITGLKKQPQMEGRVISAACLEDNHVCGNLTLRWESTVENIWMRINVERKQK